MVGAPSSTTGESDEKRELSSENTMDALEDVQDDLSDVDEEEDEGEDEVEGEPKY